MKFKFIIGILLLAFFISCDNEELAAEDELTNPIDQEQLEKDQEKPFYVVYFRNVTGEKITIYLNKEKSYFEGRELNEDDKLLTFSLEKDEVKRIMYGNGTLLEVMNRTGIKRVFVYKNGVLFKKYENEFYKGKVPSKDFFDVDRYMTVDRDDYIMAFYDVDNLPL